jgi:cytochrome c peroxidase
MHNGIFQTLEEVVDFYNLNELTGGPLSLTPAEKAELVTYLKTL